MATTTTTKSKLKREKGSCISEFCSDMMESAFKPSSNERQMAVFNALFLIRLADQRLFETLQNMRWDLSCNLRQANWKENRKDMKKQVDTLTDAIEAYKKAVNELLTRPLPRRRRVKNSQVQQEVQ